MIYHSKKAIFDYSIGHLLVNMNAGKFIKLDILLDNFGAERVFQTARRLREAGLFDKGWKELDAIVISNFLFALFASKSPVYSIRSVYKASEIFGPSPDKTDPRIIPLISRIITEEEVLESIDYLLVSQRNGDTEVYLKDGKKLPGVRSGHNPLLFHSNKLGETKDYDNETFDPYQVDSMTKVDYLFFVHLVKALNEA